MKRGPKTAAHHIGELRQALRVLDEPIALEELSVAHLPIVRRRAETEFPRRTCAVGLASRVVLREALGEIAESLACLRRLACLADGLRQGLSQKAISESLDLSEEQLSR